MAKAKIAAVIGILALFQVSCAAARRHGKPAGPCDADAAGLHHCTTMAASSIRACGGTPAVMTVNVFKRGEEGGGPAACDGRFHSDGDLIVALSTRWFAHGRRCHRAIRITSAQTGRTVEATVVDECDSRRGCGDDVVDSSRAVWEALGLHTDAGEVRVTWSDA